MTGGVVSGTDVTGGVVSGTDVTGGVRAGSVATAGVVAGGVMGAPDVSGGMVLGTVLAGFAAGVALDVLGVRELEAVLELEAVPELEAVRPADLRLLSFLAARCLASSSAVANAGMVKYAEELLTSSGACMKVPTEGLRALIILPLPI